MHPGYSYVITNGEGHMIFYGSCTEEDLFHVIGAATMQNLTCMFGPYDGTGE
jgi:hypothetical protein